MRTLETLAWVVVVAQPIGIITTLRYRPEDLRKMQLAAVVIIVIEIAMSALSYFSVFHLLWLLLLVTLPVVYGIGHRQMFKDPSIGSLVLRSSVFIGPIIAALCIFSKP